MSKFYDEQGNEIEGFTQAELDAKVEELGNTGNVVQELLTLLGAEKPEELKEKIAELKEAENPNWREARTKIKTLETINSQLKAAGKMINDAGQIVEDNGKGLTAEQIRQEASKGAREELINERIDDTLSSYTEEEQKVIKHYFNKLSNGEELTLKTVDKFLAEAIRTSSVEDKPNQAKNVLNRVGGGTSIPATNAKNFAETDAGKGLLNQMGIKIEDKK